MSRWLLIGLIPVVGAIVLIVFCCRDSTPGDNQYGPSPTHASPEYGDGTALSGVIGEAWETYRAHARHLVTIAFGTSILSAVMVAVLMQLFGVPGIVLGALVGITATFLLQAALITAMDDVRNGRADMSIRTTLVAARPFVAAIAGVSILATVGILLGFVLLIVPGLVLLTV